MRLGRVMATLLSQAAGRASLMRPPQKDPPMISSPLIVHLRDAEWDISSKDALRDVLAPALEHPSVILDMTAVTFIDSTCLGELVRMYKTRTKEHGFEPARLAIASPRVRHLFGIVEFDRLWPIFETLEEAIAHANEHDTTLRESVELSR